MNETGYNEDILDYQSDMDESISPGLEEQEEHEDAWVDDPTPMPRAAVLSKTKHRKPRVLRQSAYGIEYPPLPSAMIRKLATHLAASKVSKDTLRAISEVSDLFFRQTSDSLCAFANHAGRKTIDDADALQLMLRSVLSRSLHMLAVRF